MKRGRLDPPLGCTPR